MKRLSFPRHVILCFLFTLISIHTYSQCDPLNQPEPVFECAQSGNSNFVCDFNGLCSDLIPGSWGGEAVFCAGSSLQNPHWYSFVSNGELLDFSIDVGNCAGAGIQWALFDQCNSLASSVLCNGSATPDGGSVQIIYSNAIEGHTYYLVIDGFSGTTCSLVFSEKSGVAKLAVESSIEPISGDTIVCSGALQTYSHPGFGYANFYSWSIDGNEIHKSNFPFVQFEIPADIQIDTFELCLTAFNKCDLNGQTICHNIIISEDQTIYEVISTCPGDSVLFQGQYYQQGTYQLPYEGTSACYSGVELDIINFPESEDTTYTIVVCEENEDFLYNGSTYAIDSLYNNVVFEHEGRCDYTANMIVQKIDGSGLHITSNKDTLPCLGAQAALLKLEGSILSANEMISQTYIWTKFSGGTLGHNKNLTVNKPGEYLLTVTSIFKNPEDLKDMEDTIICIQTLSYVIHDSQVPYEEPDIILSGSDVESGTYMLEIANIDFIDPDYLWAIPAGIMIFHLPDGKISIFLPEKGVYNFCVYVHTMCEVLDSFCFTITVDETIKNKPLKPDLYRIKENPVGSVLRFFTPGNKILNPEIQIFNINGNKSECKVSDESSSISVEVSHLPPGIYFYTITNDDGLRTVGKFIKI